MRKYKTYNVPKNFEIFIQCNMCGKEMDCEKIEYEEFMTDTIHNFKVVYGYSEENDGEIWNFDLCSGCIKDIVKNFKIGVKIDKFL